jgi:hypothetical protein
VKLDVHEVHWLIAPTALQEASMDTLPERDQQPVDEWATSAMNADLVSVEIPVPHTSFEIWGRSPRLESEAADGHILRGLD